MQNKFMENKQLNRFIQFLKKYDFDIQCCGFSAFLTEAEKKISTGPEENPNYQFGHPLGYCTCFDKEVIRRIIKAFKTGDDRELIKFIRKKYEIAENFDVIGWRKWKREKELRKARRKGREPIPLEIRKKIFERDNYQCQMCGATENLSIDHIVPVVKGGDNKVSNLRVLCRKCNSIKGAKLCKEKKKK